MNNFSNPKGFTLVELLVIVAILAIVAGGVLMYFDRAEEDASFKIAQHEIFEIKKAILQFRTDTGYLPKQGPFALVADGGAVPVPPEGVAWFKSPANFSQLYQNPLLGTGHPLAAWDPDTRRGWRGPYLSRNGEGFVDVGGDLNSDGTGSPTSGAVLANLRGVADPFVKKPEGIYLAWRSAPGGETHDRWGRPYFLFDLANPSNARIVGSGVNGTYDAGAGDDLSIHILR